MAAKKPINILPAKNPINKLPAIKPVNKLPAIKPVNKLQEIDDARTIQQKVFVGDHLLTEQNDEIKEYIKKNEETIGTVQNEYEKVKKLLIKYKIIKEQLELNYMKKAKQIKNSVNEIRRRQEDLDQKYKEQIIKSGKRDAEYKRVLKYIDGLREPLNQWKDQLKDMRQKGTFQEKEVRKMLAKSGLHDQKIEEYWQVIRKMDELMAKLNTVTEQTTSFMANEEKISKQVAEELKDLKLKLIKTTEQVGGQKIRKIARNEKINDNFIKFISNPIEQKLFNKNMSGGAKINSKKLWVKDDASYIFNKFNRKQLDKLAKKWGMINPQKFKNKNQLSKSLKTLMFYKSGCMIKRKHYNTVCKNIDVPYKQFKNVKQIKLFLDNKLKNVVI